MTMTEAGPDVRPLTPGEHRALAEADIAAMRRNAGPGTPQYHGLALSALAHILSAVAAYLEPPPPPDVPGMPSGWQISIRRSPVNSRFWGYTTTDPDGREWPASKFQWAEPENALAAGIKHARQISERTARENGGG